MLRPVARAVLRQIPSARQAVRRGAGSQPAASPITVQTLYSSLEQSLRQLRTDHVDFFFLHDVPPSAVAQDGIFSALVQLRDQGKIRWFGVSSSLETAAAACQQRPEAIAAQLPVNLDNLACANEVAQKTLANNGRILLANNIFGGVDGAHASQQTLQKLAQDRILPGGLREKLTQLNGTAASSLMASVMLPIVLRTIRANVAIVSMMSPQRVQANVEAVEHDPWTEEELTLLYARLTGKVEDLASTA
jgi:aryl-alcohol dehydrogenase-like predicted oxidoreductase